MAPRWIRSKAHRPRPDTPFSSDDDWVLVGDRDQDLARTYAFAHGPQRGRWLWTLSAWGGHQGMADDFDKAREAVKQRLAALGIVKPGG